MPGDDRTAAPGRQALRSAAGAVAGSRRRLGRARRLLLLERHPPQRHVFVVTGGRSGSTLVQGLLNVLPQTLVRGENGLFVLHLFRAQRTLRVLRREFAEVSGPTTSAFYGLDQTDPAAMVATSRRMMREQLLGRVDPRVVDVLGFKEVRWDEVAPDETEGFFRFFDDLFPNAHYVLNTREPAATVQSGFWRQVGTDSALQKLSRTAEIQDFLRRTRPRRTFDTSFEVLTGSDVAARDTQLSGLASFALGRPCGPEIVEAMATRLSIGHGPYPFGASKTRGGRPQE